MRRVSDLCFLTYSAKYSLQKLRKIEVAKYSLSKTPSLMNEKNMAKFPDRMKYEGWSCMVRVLHDQNSPLESAGRIVHQNKTALKYRAVQEKIH